jgi:hypothetical protein
MSASRLAKKILMPSLNHHADLHLANRWIAIKPVHHVFRGILIESCDHDSYFVARWAVSHFCEPFGTIPLDWGDRIFDPASGLWLWDDPEMPARFARVLETQILPMLRTVDTLDDLADFLDRTHIPGRYFEINVVRQIPFLAARGNLDAARCALAEIVEGRTIWSDPYYVEEVMPYVEPMKKILADGDRGRLARQLYDWEVICIEKLRMRKIWEPTPFPLELMA